jgi:hypothetical protein
MSRTSGVTYPPELLPRAEPEDEVEVFVCSGHCGRLQGNGPCPECVFVKSETTGPLCAFAVGQAFSPSA